MAHNVKKKKKNKYLPMLVLVVVLLGLLIAYSAMSAANARAEAERLAEEEAANAAIVVVQKDAADITAISYSKNGGEELNFVISGSKWSYVKDEKFPLNQTVVSSMAYAVSSIEAVCEVDGEDTGEYGFEVPAFEIKVTYSDGTQNSYEIGNYNSFNSSYYFKADGDLYMISSSLISAFNYDEEDLMELDSIPSSEWSDVDYITDITVTSANGESNVISDSDGKTSFADALSGISLKNCVDYYAEENERADFGLDSGVSVTVKYRKAVTSTDESGNESTSYLETTYTLLIGNSTDDGYYVSPAKSDIVYLAGAEDVDNVLDFLTYEPADEDVKGSDEDALVENESEESVEPEESAE